MQFPFFPLRFEFIARETLWFPPGKAANILRGALGIIFQRIVCRPGCHDARTCEIRSSCPYAQVFEPMAQGSGPSGLNYWPRPFVFRARHLNGCTIPRDAPFYFDLHLFSQDPKVLAYFVETFAAIADEGLGPHRAKAELQRVRRIAVDEQPEQLVSGPVEPIVLDLMPPPSAPHRIRVEFLSPTELKHDHKIVCRPDFPVLFGRIRDRISTLRALYGAGPLEIDFRGIGERAASVAMTRCEVRREEAERISTRTGQSHSLGGFVGVAEYEGDLSEFLPYLEAGRWVGVGRQAVWGKGEIAISNF
jgi:hypothetical protein